MSKANLLSVAAEATLLWLDAAANGGALDDRLPQTLLKLEATGGKQFKVCGRPGRGPTACTAAACRILQTSILSSLKLCSQLEHNFALVEYHAGRQGASKLREQLTDLTVSAQWLAGPSLPPVDPTCRPPQAPPSHGWRAAARCRARATRQRMQPPASRPPGRALRAYLKPSRCALGRSNCPWAC